MREVGSSGLPGGGVWTLSRGSGEDLEASFFLLFCLFIFKDFIF